MSSKNEAAAQARSHAEDLSAVDSTPAIRRGDRIRSSGPAGVRTFALGLKGRTEQALR
jgi:hypothetical protein